ncbi:MAG: diacylglycerol/lipid kinase family protein [Gemmatimonadota bacterium]
MTSPRYPIPATERIVVLMNRKAAGFPDVFRRRVAAAFAHHGVPFDLLETEEPGDVYGAAQAAANAGVRAVAAAGGDGTVAEALRGTAGTEVPVAILPCGTGNQLALNFDVPPSLEGAVQVAVEGQVEEIDLGKVNGEYFALIAGAGLDAEVMAAATAELKSRLGFAAYLYSGVKQAITPQPAAFRIVADGEEMEMRATMVLVANVGQLGAGPLPVEVQVAPRVSFRDGLLDVCVFAPRTLPEFARVVWKVARRQYAGDDRMIFFQARHVRVESDPPVAAQVDGEVSGQTPIEAEIVPLAGRVLVPR